MGLPPVDHGDRVGRTDHSRYPTIILPSGIDIWFGMAHHRDMSNHTTTEYFDELFDADTNDAIGPATADQINASLAAGPTGIILIDADGDVVEFGTWPANQKGVRRVYVM